MLKRDLRTRSLDEFFAGSVKVDGTKAPRTPKGQKILDRGPVKVKR